MRTQSDDQSELDDDDIRILNELQKDCRQSNRSIAKTLSMGNKAVSRRIDKMQEEGVIKGFKAVLSPEGTGNLCTTFVLIQINFDYLMRQHQTQFDVAMAIVAKLTLGEKTKDSPSINEIHTVTGEWDILLKIRGSSLKEIAKFIVKELRTIKGVGRTCMYIVLDTHLEDTDLKLANKRPKALAVR
jgi:Lrp/AsnC family leucine-responsive transcriptional regulator